MKRAAAIIILLALVAATLLFSPSRPQAQITAPTPAITIINPVRGNGLGHETDDLLASLKAQWQITQEANVKATWLFQYGALANKSMTEFAKREMKDQEFGLLFEIDKQYADAARVPFRGQGPWYRSDGLLLISYDQSERRKLVDTAFAKFKETFGYYPKTVGAWWIGGDSLTYMQQKYGITAAMRAADQFNLDFYSIWGTPWNIPYLAAKNNEGIPAASYGASSKVVTLQWAIRDPLQGYADATYSLQDYPMKGYGTDYVDYLASIFLQKPFGNMVMGLENGATLEKFEQTYKIMLTKAKELEKNNKASIIPAKDYAADFLNQKSVFAGTTHFLSTGYNSSDQSFWYVSQNYRATVFKTGNSVYLIDLRSYASKVPEDFDTLPNSQPHLIINTPSIIDSMRFPDKRILLATTTDPLTVKEQGDAIILSAGSQNIGVFTPTSLKTFEFAPHGSPTTILFDQKEIPLLSVVRSIPIEKFLSGVILRAHIPYFPLDRTTYPYVGALLASLTLGIIFISLKARKFHLLLLLILILPLAFTIVYSRSYLALTPFEMGALQFVKAQHKNVILVKEVDYGLLPIYKAVKPLLYIYPNMAEILTAKKWTRVLRPESNVLKITNFDDKLIVIPRYLGTDISDYEIESLHLKKIFDNAQIAIFEKI